MVNKIKRPCTNASLFDNFALESREGSRNDKTFVFLESSWSLGLSLNPQRPNDAIWRFFVLIWFEPYFGHLLFLLEKKKKSIRFRTKLYVKVPTILRPNCSSLLLGSKPVQRNLRHFVKSFRRQCAFSGLMKLNDLPQMLFLLIVFHQKVKKDLEMNKELCFWTPRRVWACLFTLSVRTTPFGVLQTNSL